MIMKSVLITSLVIAISIIHFFPSDMAFHTLHQQLFFIPLVMASFWFGMVPGIFIALGISFLYGLPLIVGEHGHTGHLFVATQIIIYLFITALVGWLSDLERKQEHKLVQGERATSLGRAASALSFEVNDIAIRIEDIFKTSGGLKDESADKSMLEEINRLERLLESLGQFQPPVENVTLSKDFNDIIQNNLEVYRKEARRKRVKIILDLDPNGCPSMLESESIPRIFESLVSNAISFSSKGQSIILRTTGGGDASILEVIDHGSGVKKENVSKLFISFFTTKTDGFGLSLSSGRKALRHLGGDLIYEPGEKGGAVFKMIIPRDSRNENFNEFVTSKINSFNHNTTS